MKSDTQLKITVMRFLMFCFFFFKLSTSLAARNDVLIIVNDNSIDSPQIGNYYAQQRGIDPANIVHVNVPDSYFISWSDFRRLRDQLIHFMQLNTLDDPALVPVTCVDGEPPYYCAASMDQLRIHTRIRYLVATRGVPTRMTVDGSTLFSPNAPTSVDNYLKYWLINYFTDDIRLAFSEREIAFGDGRGMRPVVPATDHELIVGRIDGLDLNAARALVDRALAVERAGIYGRWYGSTKFWRWRDANAGNTIYPKSDNFLQGWRYALGLWGEDRAECSDYLNFSGFLTSGKAPSLCQVQFNDDRNSSQPPPQSINYPAPGNANSRIPKVVDALGYQGWRDGQAALGSFAALLNWRKNDQCTITLCDNAADPAVCRANSSDIFGELNTACVGVADGFMAYNHQSWPVSYMAVWPTNWFQSTSTGSTGWNDAGHGDVNQLAFPEVRNDDGFDDSNSLWFRHTDQVASPTCYAVSDFTGVPTVPCDDQRRLVLSQKIPLTPQTFDPNSPQTYRVSLRYRTLNVTSTVALRARLFIHETGAGNAQIDYGVQTLASLTPVDTIGWATAEVLFTLDPLRHTTNSFDGIKVTLDTVNAFAGELGIDVVSVKEIPSGLELVTNGSFSQGHRQTASGDHAATFLNRLGGVAAWGSVSHHQSGGSAFASNGLESMVYFLRGLPLGDAVWFDESQNSGILYGDPLYSPAAVRLNPINSNDLLGSSTGTRLPFDLFGSTVNGRDTAQVSTTYRVDICPGDDFFACDQAQSWLSTGISGQGGNENALLGTLDTTSLAGGQYTLRLQVTSLNNASGRSQTINDYYVAAINDPPVAIDGNIKTLINVDGFGAVTVNDDNVGTLRYSIVSNASKGTVFIDSVSGIYRYRPNPGITGMDSFTFKANDGIADSNIATVTVKVATTNAAPVANAGTLATNEDVAANSFLNASDIDGDILSYSLASNPAKGTVVITDAFTGAYTYTPVANANGGDSFTFNVNDGLAVSNTATVNISISAINDPPVADAGLLATSEDVVASNFLSASDIDGDTLTYSIVSNATKGTVLITDTVTGAYTYTPALNTNGSDSFIFKANDGLSDSNFATVNVTVAAVNDPPVAQSSNLNTDEDVAVNSILIASDIDGDALTYSIISNGSKGAAIITNASTGAYSYTPDANANGTDSLTFNVTDGVFVSNTATVSINITALNDAPTAQDALLDVTEDFAAGAVLSASDVDGDSLLFSISSNAGKGSVVITDATTGAYTYSPYSNENGPDSFKFVANDGLVNSNIATVNINIAAVNDAPVANNISLNTNENTVASSVLNANDPDGDALTYSIVSTANKGTVVITDTATGAYTYTPDLNAVGTDSFTFKVNDGAIDSTIATVSISITLVNVAPVANNGTLSTNEDITANGTLAATDGDADPLIYSIVSNGSKGLATLTDISTGAYSYIPNANANGADSFTFRVNDGLVNSNLATVNVNITSVNDAPVATGASLNTNEDIALNGTLIASDVESDSLTYSIVNNGLKGGVQITNAATGAFTYTPNTNIHGMDSFSFKVNDGLADSNTATVSIVIAAVNDTPLAQPAKLNVKENTVASSMLIASDPDADALTYSIVTNGSKGTAVITNASTGAYRYTPNLNATGTDSFSFKVNDGQIDSSVAIVAVNIALVNVRPVVYDSSVSTYENIVINGSLNATDGDGDALSYSIVSNGNKGTVVITNASTGAYRYTPNPGAVGVDSFTFKANDGLLDSGIATVSVTIILVNFPPQANDDILDTDEDIELDDFLHAIDFDGDSLSYSIVTNGSKGTAVITNAGTGAFAYTPNANASGIDSFTFKVNDGLLDSATATVTVNIVQINDAPVVTDSSFSVISNGSIAGSLSSFDIDDDNLIYTIIDNPGKGVVVVDVDNGIYTYTPNPGATGTDSFTYSASDGQASSNVATVTIQLVSFSKGDSGGSSGSLNMLFILLLSLLPGLRLFTARRVRRRP